MRRRILLCRRMPIKMKPKVTEAKRRPRNLQEAGPNWILMAGGALLSTLSIHLGYKLKQFLDTRQTVTRSQSLIGNRKPMDRKKSASFPMHSDAFCFHQDEDGSTNVVEVKQNSDGQMMSEPEISLPLVTVPTSVFNEENGVMWSSSPDRLELPQKPFHQSNSSDSPCVSESGSNIFSKREVIQKLRQQLKRRDDMILEMQDQIAELQNSHSVQLSHSSHLQSLLDAANRDLFDLEREIQRLRKAFADHCIGHISSGEKSPNVPTWPTERKNGHTNGFLEIERNSEWSEKTRGYGERIELLKREVIELKELIEGKDYLLKSYKEQKSELSMKLKELQLRLDSQLPNIL